MSIKWLHRLSNNAYQANKLEYIKMKVYDCQNELKQAFNHGDNFVVTYRTIYEIKHSHGAGEYIKQKVYSHYGKLPLIGKGRFIFTTSNHVQSLMEGV